MSRVISATEFKAKCLGLLEDVNESGETIIVTKRGRPVATLQAMKTKGNKHSFLGAWAGKVKIVGDIVHTDDSHLWDMLRDVDPLTGLEASSKN